MDTQTYQYDTSFDLHTNNTREEAIATPNTPPTPVLPSEEVEYWIFDNGICG